MLEVEHFSKRQFEPIKPYNFTQEKWKLFEDGGSGDPATDGTNRTGTYVVVVYL